MKFMLFTLPTVPATAEEREALRPISRNNERYQMMLEELRQLVGLADDAGFDVFATTEHHFHSEGFELSVAPLLLYADLAARTKQISFAPLGLVLPTHDPIRVAEELAVLDHLTKGRVYAGFARGYQDRWVNVLGQKYHVGGAPMDGSSIDAHNRKVYEEMFDIIRKAWTQETLTYDGEYYQVPYPHDEGIKRWPAHEWTRQYGAPGELDDDNVVRQICVGPRPYQDPHPPLFQPFSVSENTIRYTAKEGITPWILISHPPDFTRLCDVYRQVAADEGGRTLGIGESVGAFRSVHFGESEQEALDLFVPTQYEGFIKYFHNFGFSEAFRLPEDNERYPLQPFTPLPREVITPQRLRDVKYSFVGTPDQILYDFEDLATIHGTGELEWFGWFFDQGVFSWDEAQRQMEYFAKHIIPRFK